MTGSQQTQLGLAGKLVGAGSAACIADAITFPLDVAKVRLQLQGEGAQSGAVKQYRGVLGTVVTIAKQEGPSRLYGGLGPGLQRQACFATVRIGFYDSVKDAYSKAILAAMMGVRILAAVTTGGLAVVFAQPTDVVKVRMQAQSGTAPRRYKNSFQAYKTIGRVEGFRGLYKGTLPNIARNSIVNAAELVCYDSVKEAILSRNLLQDNIICHFFSAFGAGFCATVVASPVDVVKTRFMNSGAGKYTGATDCAIKMFHEGGFKAFYKGFTPSFVRLGSWNICMFVTYEQLKRLFHYLGNQDIIAGTEPHTLHLSRYSVLAEPSTAILL
ncbi:oxoglutarate/malate carrier protein, putative [Ixodes scapularis]|uniref:Oxoglutarate/malate carrier protein, putative n=1 Tax=Ixodes scapularis TaxID=6945 RepID=B7PD13_IXOSC|nr:oxoglutarate/malate carrier protein, putative [Ixodes scapularis]|eukprot:XP_002410558.1 oxoglutarate/malate carrier protein, putative [Ixodes scapularis]